MNEGEAAILYGIICVAVTIMAFGKDAGMRAAGWGLGVMGGACEAGPETRGCEEPKMGDFF